MWSSEILTGTLFFNLEYVYKGMNAFMTMLQSARKAGKKSFVYKGHTYVQHVTKTGLKTYKKK